MNSGQSIKPLLPCWRAVAASVRGSAHRRAGQPCQDAFRWQLTPSGTLVAAVADGAGSASLGDAGARTAARSAVAELCRLLGPDPGPDGEQTFRPLLLQAMAEARKRVQAAAAVREAEARELATTLTLVAARPDLVAAAQVGDGAALVADREGGFTGLTRPQVGEYVNETLFLVSPDALGQVQTSFWGGEAAHVALVTDGIQRLCLKMPQGEPHPPFFTPLFHFLDQARDLGQATSQLKSFLGSPRVTEQTTDDVTMLLFSLVP